MVLTKTGKFNQVVRVDYVELDNDDLTELVQGRSCTRIKLTQKLENDILYRCAGSLE